MYVDLLRQRECKVCLSNLATVLFLPCGHLSACPACAPHLQVRNDSYSWLIFMTHNNDSYLGLSRLSSTYRKPTWYLPFLKQPRANFYLPIVPSFIISQSECPFILIGSWVIWSWSSNKICLSCLTTWCPLHETGDKQKCPVSQPVKPLHNISIWSILEYWLYYVIVT